MPVNRRRFSIAAGALAATPAGRVVLAYSRTASARRAGVAFGADSTALEVTAGIDLTGRTILVTGATSGLGLETMRVLALRGAHVIGSGRTLDKAKAACESVQGRTTPIALELERRDLIVTATDLVRTLGMPLDGIVCNAGIMALPQLEQVYGLEKHLVVNHLGHFILVNRLLPQVQAAPQGRVVVVSSLGYQWAPEAGIEFDNLDGSSRLRTESHVWPIETRQRLVLPRARTSIARVGRDGDVERRAPRHHQHQPRPALRSVEARRRQTDRLDVHEIGRGGRGDLGVTSRLRRRSRACRAATSKIVIRSCRKWVSTWKTLRSATALWQKSRRTDGEVFDMKCDGQRITKTALHALTFLGWSMLSLASANAQTTSSQPASIPTTLSVAGVAGAAQAAYFSANAAELERLATATTAWAKSTSPREQYTYAYVQFRTLQVAIGAKRKDVASKAGDACVDTVDAIVKREPKFAEAYALQSACYGYMTNLGGNGRDP
jgi:NAD(P)-dependent dehydrogenase (short-subunit alcohol dehydrogenase family)